MLDRIKRLGTETAVYGISTIVGRFLTFILTPLYTHFLFPADLGVVATLYAYIAFLNVIYAYGMEAAFMKYVSTRELGDERTTFTVAFGALAGSSVLLTLPFLVFPRTIAALLSVPDEMSSIVACAGLILGLDALTVVPYASLRMEHRAGRFVAVRLLSILLNVVLNAVLLMKGGMGVVGIFLSGVLSSGFAVVLLAPTIVQRLRPSWSGDLLRALLRFGLPTVPAGLAAMLIQVIDRPILEAMAGRAAVGVYQVNHRLGIAMMLVVSMVDFAWRPFLLSHAGDPDAKGLFARVLTYLMLVMTALFLAMSFFIDDIVRAPVFWGHPLVDPRYWEGLTIVPLILLGYLFLGLYNNLIAGIYIEKQTRLLPAVTIAGAMVNVVANVGLIPILGYTGSAVALLASYVVMAGGLYLVVRRVYPVPYEWGRLAKIAGAGACAFALSRIVDGGEWQPAWEGVWLVVFVVILMLLRVFQAPERAALARLVATFRRGLDFRR